MSLRRRLVFSVALLVSTVVGLISSYFISHEQELLRRALTEKATAMRADLDDKGTALVRSVAMASTRAVTVRDYLFLAEVIGSTVHRDAGIVYGMIVDQQGRALLHSDPSLAGRVFNGPADVAAAAGEDVVLQVISPDGEPVLDAAAPIHVGSERWGTVRFGLSMRALNDAIASDKRIMEERVKREVVLTCAAGLMLALLGSVIGGALAGHIVQPVRVLTEGVRRVQEGRLGESVTVSGSPEVVELAGAFNQMSSALQERESALRRNMSELQDALAEVRELSLTLETRVEERTRQLAEANRELTDSLSRERATQAQLVQAGRMAAVGTLVAGLSHEINNPVGVIVGYVQGLLRHPPADARARQALEGIERQAQRASGLIRALLDFSRDRRGDRAPVSPAELLAQTRELANGQASAADVALAVLTPDDDCPKATMNAQEIQSALLNMVSNAIDATPAKGHVQLRARAAPGADGSPGLELSVADSGKGIAPEVLPHIFDPFFTTKQVGRGTGLGLSLAQQIVDAHGGHISVDTTVGVGTTVRVWLPVQQPPADA